jgi:hypothetical protein
MISPIFSLPFLDLTTYCRAWRISLVRTGEIPHAIVSNYSDTRRVRVMLAKYIALKNNIKQFELYLELWQKLHLVKPDPKAFEVLCPLDNLPLD